MSLARFAIALRPRVIITSGPGSEPLDGVRRITNHSTGELGAILAREFAARGYEVVCLQGMGATVPCRPEHARVQTFTTNDDLLVALQELASAPITPVAILHAAALCDFRVARVETPDGRSVQAPKLDSRAAGLRITLEPAAKIIASLRSLFPRSFLVGWKFEMAASSEELRAKAQRQLAENATDLCVLNGPAYGPGVAICNRKEDILHLPDKTTLARQLAVLVTAEWQATGSAAIRPEQPPTPSTPETGSISDPKHQPLADAVVAILEQGLGLLDTLELEAYTQRLPQAFNAAIGGHYRHCLEHFEILLRSAGREIDFDARRRDERIENDLDCARQATRSLLADARSLDLSRFDAAVEVRSDLNHDEAATVRSTRARETLYAISHAVHHYALIGIMCRILEVRLPAGFGVAPSTLRYQRNLATR